MSITVNLTENTAGLTDAKGFFASAAHADVRRKKDGRLDTGILFSPTACVAAGVFTKNAVKAAPVLECCRILNLNAPIHGIVANSGNANACTGRQGAKDAGEMAAYAAKQCDAPEDSFLVCSTGRIGELLPMSELKKAIAEASSVAKAEGRKGEDFAKSILTSDTRPKTCSATFQVDGKTVTVAGAAKGAGMIQPNMATMLAFLTTDIAVAPQADLKAVLQQAVDKTFNAITVDGDMSTNDTVLLLANGAAGVSLDDASRQAFQEAVYKVCDSLADKIVADGERITKVVEILVEEAAHDDDAEKAARAIGNSLLVKTSWFGNDPNWGRLMDAVGYSGAKIDPASIDISYGDVPAIVGGDPIPENKPKWKEVVSNRRFTIRVKLKQGEGAFRLRATDLTEGYVNFNKSE